MRNAFVDTVIRAGEGDERLVFLTGDAGLGVFDDLRTKSPHKVVNLGVAEQNMAGFAAGMALTGFKVFVYNIIPFLLYRPYEEVRNDICCQNLPVVLVGTGSGLTYAPAGMSHYAIEDLGLAATLPNLTVLSPADPAEARAAARFALAAKGPVYVRLSKRGDPVLHSVPVEDLTKPLLLREGGGDITLVFHGSIGPQVLGAAKLLDEVGLKARVLSVSLVQPLNEEALLHALGCARLVVSVEEHQEATGLGMRLSRLAARRAPRWRLRTLGLPTGNLNSVNDAAGMRARYGLDSAALAGKVAKWADGE